MRTISVRAVGLTIAMATAMAFAAAPVVAQDAAVSPLDLVGSWTGSERLPDGNTMATHVMLTQSATFRGIATVEDHEFWTYSGTWELNGRQLVWHYERSSRPLPDDATTAVDDVVSVTPTTLVLSSKLNGTQHTFTREKQK